MQWATAYKSWCASNRRYSKNRECLIEWKKEKNKKNPAVLDVSCHHVVGRESWWFITRLIRSSTGFFFSFSSRWATSLPTRYKNRKGVCLFTPVMILLAAATNVYAPSILKQPQRKRRWLPTTTFGVGTFFKKRPMGVEQGIFFVS